VYAKRPEQTAAVEQATMPRRLIPYSRFSGKRQEAGHSQERQDDLAAEMAERVAREEGVQIDWSLCLRDKGLSAFRGANWKRGNLGKFIDLVDAGVIPKGSILCIERVNRLSRMTWMKQVELWKEILSRGIIIRTCDPPERYTAERMDEFSVGCPVVIYMMSGHLESKQKSDWSFAAFDARKRKVREEGIPHGLNCPDWIRKINEPHPLDPERNVTVAYKLIEERQKLMEWMHERTQKDGWGSIRIARDLNERRVPPWGPARRWTSVSVYRILSTRKAIGEHQPTRLTEDGRRVPDGPPIKNHYPAAISEECHLRTLSCLRGRRTGHGGRHSQKASNLFTHLVIDAHDGKPAHVIKRGQSRKTQSDYLAPAGVHWAIPYFDFEKAVLAALSQLKARDVDGRHLADALAAKVEALQEERSEQALDLEALNGQIRALRSARWPRGVVERMAELEDAIAAKDEELRLAKEAANTSTRTESLADLKTCLKALKEARGKPEEVPLRHRIKGRIPLLVHSIWLRVQAETRKSRYVHVRIYLHGGQERYLLLTFGTPKTDALDLQDADFRGGAERGYNRQPASYAKLSRKPVAV
jgi:hypothetical protein